MQGRQNRENGKHNDLPDRSPTSEFRVPRETGKQRSSGSTGAYRFSGETGAQRKISDGTGAYRLSDLTGRQPVIPRRPPGMSPHLDNPPPTPRVVRPTRKPPRPKTWRWWLGALVILLVGGTLVGIIAYGATNFFFAASSSLGPASTAADFLGNLQTANYDQAYQDLSATATAHLSNADFTQRALATDRCYGRVTNYQEISGSATVSADQNTRSFSYTITRSKLKQTYTMTLTLQKDATGSWFISSYGGELAPTSPTCRP